MIVLYLRICVELIVRLHKCKNRFYFLFLQFHAFVSFVKRQFRFYFLSFSFSSFMAVRIAVKQICSSLSVQILSRPFLYIRVFVVWKSTAQWTMIVVGFFIFLFSFFSINISTTRIYCIEYVLCTLSLNHSHLVLLKKKKRRKLFVRLSMLYILIFHGKYITNKMKTKKNIQIGNNKSIFIIGAGCTDGILWKKQIHQNKKQKQSKACKQERNRQRDRKTHTMII